jgi:hypothetical protein
MLCPLPPPPRPAPRTHHTTTTTTITTQDVMSTSGTEPSHMHSRDDLNCNRGYETWLAREAKQRNPAIKLWGLSWGVPAWVRFFCLIVLYSD